MDTVDMFSKSLPRRDSRPGKDTSTGRLSQYHPPHAQIPRTLRSPILHPARQFWKQNTSNGKRQEVRLHEGLGLMGYILFFTSDSQKITVHHHSYQSSRKEAHTQREDEISEFSGSINKPKASETNHDRTNTANRFCHHSPLGPVRQQSIGTKEERWKSSTSIQSQDTVSRKQHSRRGLETEFNTLERSNKFTNTAVSSSEAATVYRTENELLKNSPQSLSSRIPIAAVLSDTSTTVRRSETMQEEQATMCQLDAYVSLLLQMRKRSFNQTTREHTPISSNQTHSDAPSSRTNNETIQPVSSTIQSPPKKRKKLSQHSHGEDSDNEAQGLDEVPKNKQEGKGLLFACPYLKHDRLRYSQMTCCKGNGWPNVARIKEHLYRRHRQPIHCPRCRIIFGEVNALTTHLREQPPCDLSEGTSIEGFDEAQKEQLKSRKNLKNMTEEEKWRQAYTILFPDVPAKHIPPPYFEPDVNLNLAEIRAYLRREISSLKDNPSVAEELNALLVCTSQSGQVLEALVKFVDDALTNWPQNSHNSAKLRGPAMHGAGVFTANDSLQMPDEKETTLAPGSAYCMNFADHSFDFTGFYWPQNPELPTNIPNREPFLHKLPDAGQGHQISDHMIVRPKLRESTDVDESSSDFLQGPSEDQESQVWSWAMKE